jgi:hypothetical protein
LVTGHVLSGHFRAAAHRGMIVPVLPARLVCSECRRPADPEARGWQAHLVARDDNEEEDEVVFFCPECATREFGDLRQRRPEPPAR